MKTKNTHYYHQYTPLRVEQEPYRRLFKDDKNKKTLQAGSNTSVRGTSSPGKSPAKTPPQGAQNPAAATNQDVFRSALPGQILILSVSVIIIYPSFAGICRSKYPRTVVRRVSLPGNVWKPFDVATLDRSSQLYELYAQDNQVQC